MKLCELKFPFEYDGQNIDKLELVRSPVVGDRIRAVKFARDTYGEERGDAVLVATLAEVARFNDKKIPAEVLTENLNYSDFAMLTASMSNPDFFLSEKMPSETSSTDSAKTAMVQQQNS